MVNTKFIINVEKKRYISIIFLNSINTYLMWLMNMFFKKVYNFPMGNKFRAKMSKARFEIGDHEKHVISVNANPFLKYIRIEVDGERVIDVPNLVPSRKFDLEIGNTEKHKVEIFIRLLSPVRLMVDGNEVAQI